MGANAEIIHLRQILITALHAKREPAVREAREFKLRAGDFVEPPGDRGGQVCESATTEDFAAVSRSRGDPSRTGDHVSEVGVQPVVVLTVGPRRTVGVIDQISKQRML